MASETMTVQEAIELCEPNDARASAEQWLTAMAVLVAHARATTAGTGAGGGRVTEAMVEVACAAFSREWYEDVEARPMRVALTAALRAAGVADAEG